MRRLTSPDKNLDDYVEIADHLYDRLVARLGRAKAYHCIRTYSPNGKTIPNSMHACAMMDNRARELPRDNPAAWCMREVNMKPGTCEISIARHLGKWVRHIGEDGTTAWCDKRGHRPSFRNLEFYSPTAFLAAS